MTFCALIMQTDVLCVNNADLENDLGKMYSTQLEIKDTTETNNSASYLDLLLSVGRVGQLCTSLSDKCDDLSFHIAKFCSGRRNIQFRLFMVLFLAAHRICQGLFF